MKIEQIYTGCLAQGAYYISSNGEAAIIDPLRETKPYLDRLNQDKVTLKYIFETHFHADFVSGHLDLSQKTGAPIVFGPTAQPAFAAIIAEDHQVFTVGDVTLKVLHTPGHTMESSCYLLFDAAGKELALFSGDTLFLGDVGRPDLAQKAANMSQDDLAGLLYDSIYGKILPLPDSLTIYPAHGAGSACGKNMMQQTVDTLGNQKQVNYALKQPNKQAFIQAVTEGLLPPPAYFGMNVALNKKGYESLDKVLNQSLVGLDPETFAQRAESTNALLLDTRDAGDFAKGFIPQSINIGIKGDFAPWVGNLIADVNQPILLVTDPGQEEEVITRLSRVGFDHVLGYLKGGFESWLLAGKEMDTVNRITATTLVDQLSNTPKVIDVRKEGEYEAEHVAEAFSKPLAYINSWITDIDPKEHFYIHCAGGYRSMIAASILQARGYRNFSEVAGGYKALLEAGAPRTDFVCQSKTLGA
ncbi:MBL fold metallo-hydrolase [Sphingobacterium sp. Mn56C]|uniref:MBL fold metallo-hydrolase n=1 Tax=Sphingobacterium sp. Mn56C TaxID=3395261 RepID=UPI003BC66A72